MIEFHKTISTTRADINRRYLFRDYNQFRNDYSTASCRRSNLDFIHTYSPFIYLRSQTQHISNTSKDTIYPREDALSTSATSHFFRQPFRRHRAKRQHTKLLYVFGKHVTSQTLRDALLQIIISIVDDVNIHRQIFKNSSN